MRRTVLVTLILYAVLAVAGVQAEAAYHPQLGYWIDAPPNWSPVETGDSNVVAFSDPSDRALLQIVSFPPDRFETSQGIADHITERLEAEGETAPFSYLGGTALLGDLVFDTPQGPMRGYFVFLNHPMADHAVFSYVVEGDYEDAHDLILSAVDSFAPTAMSRRASGPISAFLSGDREEDWQLERIEGPLGPVSVRIDTEGASDNQAVIEREARILSLFAATGSLTEGWEEAWRRFYRMVYRESAYRLAPLAEAIAGQFAEADISREEIPAILLEWIQQFEYRRTGSLSDLADPTTCLLEMAGDCDGLGLIYASVLHHLGFDAVLMVSLKHNHALVGVDVEGPGARFSFRETEYLVAEVTEDVDIGMIAASMADPADWLGVRLR